MTKKKILIISKEEILVEEISKAFPEVEIFSSKTENEIANDFQNENWDFIIVEEECLNMVPIDKLSLEEQKNVFVLVNQIPIKKETERIFLQYAINKNVKFKYVLKEDINEILQGKLK